MLSPVTFFKTVTTSVWRLLRAESTESEIDRKVAELVSVTRARRSWEVLVFVGWANFTGLHQLPLASLAGFWEAPDEEWATFADSTVSALRALLLSTCALFLVFSGSCSMHTLQKIRFTIEMCGVLQVWSWTDSSVLFTSVQGTVWATRLVGAAVCASPSESA